MLLGVAIEGNKCASRTFPYAYSPRARFRHSQGGTKFLSPHRPTRFALASSSVIALRSRSSSVCSFSYRRYCHATRSLQRRTLASRKRRTRPLSPSASGIRKQVTRPRAGSFPRVGTGVWPRIQVFTRWYLSERTGFRLINCQTYRSNLCESRKRMQEHRNKSIASQLRPSLCE